MKAAGLTGILLIIVGIVSLAYQGITYKTQKKVIDLGPIQATKTENHTVPLPPVLGGLALVGGVVLLIVGSRE